ncbi:MAG: excinuclease ABC subunit UvrC [Candidatus Mycalebacterium zealandia]|nr:MAG: excinuclease ABC subunit UvrC [Candidatus Mycalebacterium zealandia]
MMKNPNGRIIYIGKAANLKSRVRSYFSAKNDSRPQVSYLMREAADIDYIVSVDEHEALILENSLIKKHKPKFNIQLKDDKTYASLRLSMNEEFPRLSVTRKVRADGASYFGPFSHGGALKQSAKLVHRLFTVRDCSNSKFKRHSSRPCLNYDMGLCSGPCAGMTEKSEYRALCLKAEAFLRGDRKGVAAWLKKKMKKASDETRYEDASRYKDLLSALGTGGLEKVVSSSFTDRDIIEMAADEKSFEFVVLFHRGGGVVDKAEISAKNTGADVRSAFAEFLGRFYDEGRQVPPEIIVPSEPEHKRTYEKWLSEKRGGAVKIVAPKKGMKTKLLRLAADNARESIRKKRAGEEKNRDVLFGLKKALKLSKVPREIECFDISNTQGKETTGSAVRFSGGAPDKKRYKRYKIKTVAGQDDFAGIKEMLSRRLKRAGETSYELPDLILIDGGKGQLSAAVEAIRELGFSGAADIAAIAKGRGREQGDSIYTPGRKNPWTPVKNREGLFLLMRIRDEAHRFALGYHKTLRGKRFFR